MSKNPNGGISRKSASREWGSKARKREDAQRGLNNRAKVEAIADQLHQCDWRYSNSYDLFVCLGCGKTESAD